MSSSSRSFSSHNPHLPMQPPPFEALESRRLLSASLDDGLLTIRGTSGADAVEVDYNSTGTRLVVRINGEASRFRLNQIDRVKLSLRDGNDIFDADDEGADRVRIGLRVRGGAGNDSIDGGAGQDTLMGDGGRDSLDGEGGADSILGGSSDDVLEGGNGDDTLRGGGRNDDLDGDEGRDRLFGDAGEDDLEGGAERDRVFGGKGNDDFDEDDANTELHDRDTTDAGANDNPSDGGGDGDDDD